MGNDPVSYVASDCKWNSSPGDFYIALLDAGDGSLSTRPVPWSEIPAGSPYIRIYKDGSEYKFEHGIKGSYKIHIGGNGISIPGLLKQWNHVRTTIAFSTNSLTFVEVDVGGVECATVAITLRQDSTIELYWGAYSIYNNGAGGFCNTMIYVKTDAGPFTQILDTQQSKCSKDASEACPLAGKYVYNASSGEVVTFKMYCKRTGGTSAWVLYPFIGVLIFEQVTEEV